MKPLVSILGPNGDPIASRNGKTKGFYLGTGGLQSTTNLNSILQSLAGVGLPPKIKAQNPFAWHPWIFAAAMAVATTATSAPYTIFTETDDEIDNRKKRAKRLGRGWRGPKTGKSRSAGRRHITCSLHQRMRNKGLEVDDENPIWDVLARPNPHQIGNQLFWTTHLQLALKGHTFWLLTAEDGGDPAIGELPARIWPVNPEQMEPVLEHTSWGEQIGWWLQPTILMRRRIEGWRVFVPMSSVIEFKFPHPDNLLQAVSRLSATIYDVETDLTLKEYNRSIVDNGGDPGGVVTFEEVMEKKEEDEFLIKWSQRHQGSDKANRTALLSAGMKYLPIALTPVELQGMENLEWNRAAELACMGTPPSQIGLTEFTNYATALGQKKNFWDNTLIPQTNLVDTVLEASPLFANEPDNIVGLHDLRNVEALRSGMIEKVEAAVKLAGPELRADPRSAYEVVGLEVPPYDGDDVPMTKIGTITVDEILNPPEPEPIEGDPFAEPEEEDIPVAAQRKQARVDDFITVQNPWEVRMRRRYKSWVSAEKRSSLTRFDEAITAARGGGNTKQFVNLDEVIPELNQSKNNLKLRIRPLYSGMLETTFNFTLDDFGGIATFTMEEAGILTVMESRMATMLGGPPVTVRNRLIQSLSTGINLGESIQQLRLRVSEVYKIAASSSRSLMVARTETSGFMNSTRFAMFEAQGIEKKIWLTAGDELVRSDHKKFGLTSRKDMDFDYMEILGGGLGASLQHPHDPLGPANQVINCRCTIGVA